MKKECNNCIHWCSKESYRTDSFTYAPCKLTNRSVPDFHTCEKWDGGEPPTEDELTELFWFYFQSERLP